MNQNPYLEAMIELATQLAAVKKENELLREKLTGERPMFSIPASAIGDLSISSESVTLTARTDDPRYKPITSAFTTPPQTSKATPQKKRGRPKKPATRVIDATRLDDPSERGRAAATGYWAKLTPAQRKAEVARRRAKAEAAKKAATKKSATKKLAVKSVPKKEESST